MAASVQHLGAPIRKPMMQADANRTFAAGRPRVLADEIDRMVDELWVSRDNREFSRVIARRLGCTEAVVDRIMAGLIQENKRKAATLAEAMRNGMEMSREAAAEVWEAA